MSKTKIVNNIPKITKDIERATHNGLTASAEFVEAKAKENTTPNVDTGRLRASITHQVRGNTAIIGTNVQYAPYLEFGTGIYAEGGGGRRTGWFYKYEGKKRERRVYFTRGSRPHPFLRPALNDNIKSIKAIYKREYERGLK
jgi:HK97 gp10 family phage protein